MIDPWAGYNQGMQNLGQTFTDLQTLDQARKQQALEAKKQEMQNRVLQLQLDKANREASLESGLRDALRNAPSEGRFIPDAAAQPNIPANGSLLGALGQVPSDNIFAEKGPAIEGLRGRTEQGKPDLQKAMYQYYLKNAPEKALELDKQIATEGIAMINAGFDPQPLLDNYNAITGKNLEYLGKKGDMHTFGSPETGYYGLKPGTTMPIKLVDGIPKEKETWGDPYEASVGGKRAMVQKSSTGQIKPVVQDVSTTVVVKPHSGSSRMYSVLDTQNGNMPIMMPADELADAHKTQPGRYISASTGSQALKQTALIEDIRGNVNDTRNAANAIKGRFSKGLIAQLSLASNSNHPEAIIGNIVKSSAMNSLTPQEQEYLINLNLLIENGMAMRSVLGAGQGSDDLRNAIKATLPNAKSPNSAYVNMQLDKFEKTLNRLGRGVPQVQLRPDRNNPGGSGGGNSLKDRYNLK